MSKKALIIGFGYVGGRLATALREAGWQISALTRSADSTARAQRAEIEVISGDLDDPKSLGNIAPNDTVIFYLAPPPREGTDDPRIANFLNCLTSPPNAIVYISTTGVYGDRQGGMVSENSPLNPQTDRAMRRVAAENALTRFATSHPDVRTSVLRVSGIYGPDKLPLDRLRRGEPIVEDPEMPSYVNVIHVDDLVRICIAAAERAPRGETYNVSSNTPVSMAAYMDMVADAAKLDRPPRISWETAQTRISPGMLSYLSESRQVSSDKVVDALGVKLLYGDLKSGIEAALAASTETHEKLE